MVIKVDGDVFCKRLENKNSNLENKYALYIEWIIPSISQIKKVFKCNHWVWVTIFALRCA